MFHNVAAIFHNPLILAGIVLFIYTGIRVLFSDDNDIYK